MKLYNILSVHDITNNWSFSTNFLEANVINIILLLSGLVYILKKFLGALLIARQQKVLDAIKESEERLQKAKIRLAESEKQFEQTEIVIKQIKEEAVITAEKVRQSILDQGKLDVERLTDAGKSSIIIAEKQVREQIQQQIINLALHQASLDLKEAMTLIIQSKMIDYNILQLGEKL